MGAKQPKNRLSDNISSDNMEHANADCSGLFKKGEKPFLADLAFEDMDQINEAVLHGELSLIWQYFSDQLQSYAAERGKG